MSLDLRPEVERMVREQAAAEGMSVDDLLARTYTGQSSGATPENKVRALLSEWQRQDGSTKLASDDPGSEISSEALFARWHEQDQVMTDKERIAEDQLWEAVEQGMEETRALLGARPLTQ